jgi:hypothetical protein
MSNDTVGERIADTPEKGSRALLEYWWASDCDFRLHHLLIDTVLRGDLVAHIVKTALENQEKPNKKVTPVELALTNPGQGTIALRRSRQELLEMLLSRAVDNFQVYLVQVIRDVLQKKPEILSARKQELTLGYILQFDSIQSLTLDIIEAKVTSLSYEGFGDLEEWCQGRGIPLVIPYQARNEIVELIATRNLIVHNRGIVDSRYVSAVSKPLFTLGQRRAIEIDDLLRAQELLNEVVKLSDTAIAGKFGLPLIEIKSELRKRHDEKWSAPVVSKH